MDQGRQHKTLAVMGDPVVQALRDSTESGGLTKLHCGEEHHHHRGGLTKLHCGEEHHHHRGEAPYRLGKNIYQLYNQNIQRPKKVLNTNLKNRA